MDYELYAITSTGRHLVQTGSGRRPSLDHYREGGARFIGGQMVTAAFVRDGIDVVDHWVSDQAGFALPPGHAAALADAEVARRALAAAWAELDEQFTSYLTGTPIDPDGFRGKPAEAVRREIDLRREMGEADAGWPQRAEYLRNDFLRPGKIDAAAKAIIGLENALQKARQDARVAFERALAAVGIAS